MQKKILLYKEPISFFSLALIAFVVYLPSLSYPFQFDDLPNILHYTKLKVSSLSSLFFIHSRWVCTWLNTILYRFFDSSPYVCRLINVGFHITTGALIFWLLLRFRNKIKNYFYVAILTTTLFLLHPVQTQTVSYVIQGQLEGLASLLTMLATFCFYGLSHTKTNAKKAAWWFATILSIVLATSTKEIAIITPFLILLVDWFLISNGNWKKIKEKLWIHISTFATTFGMYIYYLKPTFFIKLMTGSQIVQSTDGNILTTSGESVISQWQFAISQFKVVLHYLWMFLWPFNICVEYDWNLVESFWSIELLIPLFAFAILATTVLILLKKNRVHPIAFGALWFAICIFPRSSFVASSELLVDYKTYLASMGWLFIIAYTINLFISYLVKEKIQNKVFWTTAACLTLALSTLTYYRNQIWSSPKNFWHDVVCKAPNKARGFNNYGMALVEEGKFDKSIFYFKRAISLNQSNSLQTFYWDPYKNLANAYAMTNEVDLAIDIIRQGLRLNNEIAELHNNLGALLLHKNEVNTAIKHLEFALSLKPDFGQAMYTMGKAYLAQNNVEEAHYWLQKACLETHMDRVRNALLLYAQTSIQLQKADGAIYALQKILKINSSDKEALANLAGVYYFTSNFPDAIKCYEKLVKLYPQENSFHKNLEVLYQKVSAN